MELNEQIKLLKNKMTLLTEEQIFGEEQLEIFKKFGTKCVATDLSRLLGCAVTRRYCIDGDDPRKNRTGKWWSQSISKDYFYQYGDSTIFIVSESGESTDAFSNDIDCGVRPVLPYSLIKEFSIEKESVNGIKIIEYGEYPQMILPFDISYLLDREYEKLKTGKIYIFTMNDLLIECEEYQCNGKKYIRFVPNYDIETFGYGILSDGRKVKKDEVYWIEVEPIRWLVDEKSDIAVTEKIMFSSIFGMKYIVNFNKTFIFKYLNTHFIKNIIPSEIKKELIEKIEDKSDELSELYQQNNLMSLIKKIDVLLLRLKKYDERVYEEFKKQYDNMLESEGQTLTLYPLNRDSLMKLLIKLEMKLQKNEDKVTKNHLDKLKQEYLLSLENDEKINIYLNEIDKMTEMFLSEIHKYSLSEQRLILKDISMIYLFSIIQNINILEKEDLENSYFKTCLKSIIININLLIEENIIKTDLKIDLYKEITLEYVLEIIRSIKIKNNKKNIIKIKNLINTK